MELIKKGIIYDRNYQLVIGLVLILSGVAFLFFVPGSADIGAKVSVYVLSGILFLLSILFFKEAYKKTKLNKQPVLQYIEFDPRQIVWVYSYVIETMPFGIRFLKMHTVYFYFKNGKYTTIRVSSDVHNKLMGDLRDRLPHASFGFTSEKEQLYKANPALLYRTETTD